MTSLTGVGGLDRTEPAYASLRWTAGERPDWWHSANLTWEFVLPSGRRFATSNLDEAVLRLADRLRVPSAEVQLLLFRDVPLEADQQVQLTDLTEVRAYRRHPFVRKQVERLQQLEAYLDEYRQAVAGEVLALFTSAYADGREATDRLFDQHDPAFYLGVQRRTLDRWARDFNAYEVQEFLREEATLRSLDRQQHPQPRQSNPEPSHETLVKRHATAINRFSGYFDADDFVPANDQEARALELHRAMREAKSALEEERAMVKRDRYLIEFVF